MPILSNSHSLLRSLIILIKRLDSSEISLIQKQLNNRNGKITDYKMLFNQLLDIRRILPDNEFDVTEKQMSQVKEKEETIKQKFKNASKLCRYLYDKILNTLNNYPHNFETSVAMYDNMKSIIFLYEKRMYQECLDLIENTKEYANQLNKPTILLELNYYQNKIYTSTSIEKNQPQLLKVKQEHKINLDNLSEYLHLSNLYHDLLMYQWNNVIDNINIEAINVIEKEIDNLSREMSNIEIRCLKISIALLWHKFNRNSSEILKHQNLLLHLFENNNFMKQEEPTRYLRYISNYFSSCYQLKQFDEVKLRLLALENEGFLFRNINLPKTEKQLGKPKFSKVDWYENILYIYLIYFLSSSKYEEAIVYLEQNNIAKIFDNNNYYIIESRLNAIFMFIILIYFNYNDFKTTLFWTNKIQEEGTRKIREDIKVLAKFLEIICIYEERQEDWREVIARKLEKLGYYIEQSNYKHPLIQPCFDALKPLSYASYKEIKEKLDALNDLILKHYETSQTNDAFLEISKWIEKRNKKS